MQKQCKNSQNGPPAAGPYSHAVTAGDFVFVSGQGPVRRDGGGVVSQDFEEQVRYTLDNLKIVLEDVGSGLDLVLKTTVFLTDMDKFSTMNGIYKTCFEKDPPARTCIQAAGLPMGIQFEIEAIALLRK